MRDRWIRYGFLFLLAINVAVVGRLAYRQWTEKSRRTLDCPSRNENLMLTETQAQAMQALRRDYQNGRSRLWSRQAKHQQALIALLAASPLDTLAIERTVSEINQTHGELQHLAIHQLIQEKCLLNAEQQAVFIEKLTQCHNKACEHALGANGCPVACSSTHQKQTTVHSAITSGGKTP